MSHMPTPTLAERLARALEAHPRTTSGVRFAPTQSDPLRMEVTADTEFDVDVERGIIRGYANISNTWDGYNTQFLTGAFADSIQERHTAYVDAGKPTRVKFLWQHDRTEPLGNPTAFREDSTGLFAESRVINPDEGIGKRALRLAAEGVVEGLSVGFKFIFDAIHVLSEEEVRAEGFDLDDPMVQMLWPMKFSKLDLEEYSLVTFPGVDDARVTEVIRSLERTLVPGWRKTASGVLTPHHTPQQDAPPQQNISPQRKGPNMEEPRATQTRGASLASALDDAITSMESDDMPRSEIIAGMGNAAGISSGTVGQILSGDIDCPPLGRLEGFAQYLNVSVSSLVEAAERDGCPVGDNAPSEEDERGDTSPPSSTCLCEGKRMHHGEEEGEEELEMELRNLTKRELEALRGPTASFLDAIDSVLRGMGHDDDDEEERAAPVITPPDPEPKRSDAPKENTTHAQLRALRDALSGTPAQ